MRYRYDKYLKYILDDESDDFIDNRNFKSWLDVFDKNANKKTFYDNCYCNQYTRKQLAFWFVLTIARAFLHELVTDLIDNNVIFKFNKIRGIALHMAERDLDDESVLRNRYVPVISYSKRYTRYCKRWKNMYVEYVCVFACTYRMNLNMKVYKGKKYGHGNSDIF